MRNDLAHGIWIKHPAGDEPALQKVTGEYSPVEGTPKVKARIDPQALNVPLSELSKLAENIDNATTTINRLQVEIWTQLQERQQEPPQSLNMDR